MNPLSVQDIVTRVQKIFGDEASVQIDVSDITRWINEAQEEIVTNNDGLMETTATASSVVNQAEYDFPDDCATFRSLQYNGYRVKYMSFTDFNQYLDGYNATPNSYGAGIPTVFMIWENKFHVFPMPNQSITDGFKIFYMRHPVEVSLLTDIPEVPVAYHKAIVDYCLEQSYEVDEDSEKQQLKNSSFSTKMLQLNDRNKRVAEFYPSITVLPEDDNFNSIPWVGGF